jgi:hypothetical protein
MAPQCQLKFPAWVKLTTTPATYVEGGGGASSMWLNEILNRHAGYNTSFILSFIIGHLNPLPLLLIGQQMWHPFSRNLSDFKMLLKNNVNR